MPESAHYVIFDYDGTLVDTAPAFLSSINRALRKNGLASTTKREISSRDLQSIITDRLTQESQFAVGAVFDSIWDEFAETLSSPFPLREGAAMTLEVLSKRGIGLALISKRGGRAGALPLLELRAAGLENLFRFVKTGVGLKEYGAAISEALEELGGRVQETVVVSDWCKDIEHAKHSGLRAVGIVGGVSDEDEHRSAGADWVIESLIEIPDLVSSQRL
jgi:phosphoglycolate phosphatase-like HAD superfamily hydrolase